MYNGTWFSPGAGSYATLTQTGQRSIIAETGCGSDMYPTTRGWNYENVSFKVTNANGDEQNFVPWRVTVQDVMSTSCAYQRGFRMASWVFPQGMIVNFVYQQPTPGKTPVLTEVNNSLGRKIKFTNPGGFPTEIDNGLTGADRRAIIIGGASGGFNYSHTDPSGAVTRFKELGIYTNNEKHLLFEVYDADDSLTAPSLRYSYDSLQRAKEVLDAGALQGYDARGPYQFFIGDGVRAERRDPLGGRYTVFYNLDRRPMAVQDELGRQTSVSYDGRGRVTEYVYPGNDKEQIQYDARNNVTRLTKVPRPCLPQGCNPGANIAIEAGWNPTWNKPDWIINPKGYRTNFTYY